MPLGLYGTVELTFKIRSAANHGADTAFGIGDDNGRLTGCKRVAIGVEFGRHDLRGPLLQIGIDRRLDDDFGMAGASQGRQALKNEIDDVVDPAVIARAPRLRKLNPFKPGAAIIFRRDDARRQHFTQDAASASECLLRTGRGRIFRRRFEQPGNDSGLGEC